MAIGQAKRSTKKRKHNDDTPTQRAVRGRAEYVLQCIRDQPWLDGKNSRLVKLLRDKYGGGESAARHAVDVAYQWLDEEREKNATRLVGYLDRVHRRTIEMGQRVGDGRVITPAAAELRKLHGVGEPDQVKLSGAVGGVSADAAALLGALKLTNAQRLAEIDKLEAEIGEAAAERPSDVPTVVVPPQVVTTTEDEDGETDDDDE